MEAVPLFKREVPVDVFLYYFKVIDDETEDQEPAPELRRNAK
tara:strand:- start:169 stop:294 length:126 start_codon:yes stop_codon:yes gene_type:complete